MPHTNGHEGQQSGRYPANFALCHLPTCQPMGTHQVRGDMRGGCAGTRPGGFGGVGADSGDGEPNARVYGMEEVQTYACADGCPVTALDGQAGKRPGCQVPSDAVGAESLFRPGQGGYQRQGPIYADTGSASRFFFTADWALDVAEQLTHANPVYYCGKASASERHQGLAGRNPHPTIKPLSLTQWLATLLLPPAAYAPRRLLAPFAGTGSEMIGAILAGWEMVMGIEREVPYVEMGRQRIAWWTGYTVPPSPVVESVAQEMPPRVDAVSQIQLTLF